LYFKVPTSYSSILGLYRCKAKNEIGEQEISIQFQRPGLPDPPNQLEVMNITHSSFILNWQSGYDGGYEQIFHIILNNNNYTEEKYTNLNTIRFEDLNEKTRYMIKIRSKNYIGFSVYSTYLIIQTKKSLIHLEEFPIIQQAYFIKDNNLRINLQLNSRLISINKLCIQYFNNDEISSCIPFNLKDGIEIININKVNLRLKLCLINQTDICSKSILIPIDNQLILSNNSSSDFIFILIG
jgi:hypothetical protein